MHVFFSARSDGFGIQQWEMPWNDTGRSRMSVRFSFFFSHAKCIISNNEKIHQKKRTRQRAERCEAPLIVRLRFFFSGLHQGEISFALWTTINNLSVWCPRGWWSSQSAFIFGSLLLKHNYVEFLSKKKCFSSSDNVKGRRKLSNLVDFLMVKNCCCPGTRTLFFLCAIIALHRSRRNFFAVLLCSVQITSRATGGRKREAQNSRKPTFLMLWRLRKVKKRSQASAHQLGWSFKLAVSKLRRELFNKKWNWIRLKINFFFSAFSFTNKSLSAN